MVIQVMGCSNTYRTRGYYNRAVAVTLKGVNNQFNITWESKSVMAIWAGNEGQLKYFGGTEWAQAQSTSAQPRLTHQEEKTVIYI